MIQLQQAYFEDLTEGKVKKLSELVEPYIKHKTKLYQMYSRKSTPTAIMSSGSDRIVVAFEWYIVNMAQGYLAGKAPMHTVKEGSFSKAYQDVIDNVRRYNDDGATFIELMHDFLITSSAYLYVYENQNNEIVYTRFDSRQTVVVYDYGTPPYPIAMVRKWIEKDENNNDTEVVEVISRTQRTQYHNGILHDTPEPLLWGDVPAIAFEHPDNAAIFEPAIGLIKAYENNMTNVKNMTEYNDTAKLMVSGFTPQNEMYILDEDGKMVLNPLRIEEETALYNAKALFIDKEGDIQWLLKTVDYSGILSVLGQMHDLITMLTGVPNMTDQAFSNADNASALGYKLYALDQYSATADRIFKKGYLRLWEIVTGRLNARGNKFNFRDIDVTFNRNVPTDKDKSIARAVTAFTSGLFSHETALNMSDTDIDAASELGRISTQQEEQYNLTQERLPQEDEGEQS